ncbi:kinase-like domain-containing protein [Paraphoma chrysanthemicola]|uniref:Kinase-like domain-containing protein n=1 Tax=Paraphoma chrysanthemicola TaxID=798071 RepID=A0A8K0W4F2_9PLEO|nr:kinase-like domain-containing protein [Paraphoma chrysanthemicola]
MDSQAGLTWEMNWLGSLELNWTTEPSHGSIEKIVRRELTLSDDKFCAIEFLAEGAFNKVYIVRCQDSEDLVMRVTLPVQPHFKTMSEDATIKYIEHHTDIPVPQVLKCSSARDEELGYEWMLMSRVHGISLHDQWAPMCWLSKELIVRNSVQFLTQLFKKRFTRIGNLYATKDLQQLPTSDIPDTQLLGSEFSNKDTAFCLSQVVSIPFFWGKHVHFPAPRGPFAHSRDWLAAQLQLYMLDADEPFSDPASSSDTDDDDEPDEFSTPEARKTRAQRLLNLLPTIFPDATESFVLHHADLNASNILIDPLNHTITGIIDWECIHTVPLWSACQTPKFLDSDYARAECPSPEKYMRDTLDDGTVVMNELYLEHLEEYEKTRLRAFFVEEMGRVCPEWVVVYRASKLKAAFGEVVDLFGDPVVAQVLDEWIERVERDGDAPSVVDILRGDA